MNRLDFEKLSSGHTKGFVVYPYFHTWVLLTNNDINKFISLKFIKQLNAIFDNQFLKISIIFLILENNFENLLNILLKIKNDNVMSLKSKTG